MRRSIAQLRVGATAKNETLLLKFKLQNTVEFALLIVLVNLLEHFQGEFVSLFKPSRSFLRLGRLLRGR